MNGLIDEIKVGDKVYADYKDVNANKVAVVTDVTKDGTLFAKYPDGKLVCGRVHDFMKAHSVSLMEVEMNGQDYHVGEVEWIYPCQQPAPKGVKISLLTVGGMQTVGHWRDDGAYIAWFPLLRRNKELEKVLGYTGTVMDTKIAECLARLADSKVMKSIKDIQLNVEV